MKQVNIDYGLDHLDAISKEKTLIIRGHYGGAIYLYTKNAFSPEGAIFPNGAYRTWLWNKAKFFALPRPRSGMSLMDLEKLVIDFFIHFDQVRNNCAKLSTNYAASEHKELREAIDSLLIACDKLMGK